MRARVDLPEVLDRAWCPAWLRDAMTGYLQVVIDVAKPYDAALPALSEALRASGHHEVVDLGSGAGGPWPRLIERLRDEHPGLRVTLTDLHPSRTVAAELGALEGIRYSDASVASDSVPGELTGIRTMFTALHHFDAAGVRSLLAAAQRDRVPFLAFEATQRSWRGLLVTLFIPLLVLALMPRVRPRRALPLVLTYLLPIVPLLIWWDGLASTLRTYSPSELRTLAAEVAEPGYVWRVEEIPVPGAPLPILQLVGAPVPQAGA